MRAIFVFLFFLSVSLLQAQYENDAGEDRISGLSISGLKRTKLSTVKRPLEKFIGLEVDKLDINEVLAAVINTGILEPISVEILAAVTGEKILTVQVREKWSIFPIPVVFVGTGGMSAGGAVYDANAFGLNDKLFLAGFYLSGGWLVTAGYIHASPGRRTPGWNIMTNFSQEDRHDGDQRDNDLRRFDLDSISFRAGLNFPLLENSDRLSASAHVSYGQKFLRNEEEAVNGPGEGMRLFGAGGGLSARRNSWDGFFLSREEASFSYTLHLSPDAASFQFFQFRGTWEKSLVPGFRLDLRTGLIFAPGVPILFESSPSATQVAILPRSFSAQNYAGVSAGLEKYLFRISSGTLSMSAAYQVAYSHGSILKNSLDHGPVGMISFYLSKLAIPALGLGAAYNVKENYFQGSFSLGMSF